MALSGIHFLNWFYLFSLNRLSLICFFNWKKKKLVWKIRVNPTRLTYNRIDPFKKTHFDPWPDWPANSINPTQSARFATTRLLWVCWNWCSSLGNFVGLLELMIECVGFVLVLICASTFDCVWLMESVNWGRLIEGTGKIERERYELREW